jgi:hypothetical protein
VDGNYSKVRETFVQSFLSKDSINARRVYASKKGLSRLLIKGAVDYAHKSDAKIVEAYPVDREESKNTSLDAFTGFLKTFSGIGFKEVIR